MVSATSPVFLNLEVSLRHPIAVFAPANLQVIFYHSPILCCERLWSDSARFNADGLADTLSRGSPRSVSGHDMV